MNFDVGALFPFETQPRSVPFLFPRNRRPPVPRFLFPAVERALRPSATRKSFAVFFFLSSSLEAVEALFFSSSLSIEKAGRGRPAAQVGLTFPLSFSHHMFGMR